ncbi:hypothetical protein TNCV_3680981 [Trichonephila clavipes]|uniref:Uncharacterized protein n=1 Tax=Trichonephila clavipes TaxID=2585209 RepID=A0A8X6RLK4_TRICX|nr:hypothetical protein TNCV_2777621 [Trichonephila clavipes]GFX91512.1 hypothetical protein TNCV_3680981 [Trichonephila clavipes]
MNLFKRRTSSIIHSHNALQLSNIPLHYHYTAITLTLRSYIYPTLFASLHFSFLGFGWKRVAINTGSKNPKDLLKKRRVRRHKMKMEHKNSDDEEGTYNKMMCLKI